MRLVNKSTVGPLSNPHSRKWVLSATNAGNPITLQESVSQRHKENQDQKCMALKQDSSDEDEDDMFVATIEDDTDAKDWKAMEKLNGHSIIFKLDTRAQCNVISKHVEQDLNTVPQTPNTRA